MPDRTIDKSYPPTPGVLLAGGLARRMGGGDKPLRTIGGQTILQRAIARLEPQCDGLALNANGDPARFSTFGLPVVSDSVKDFAGPLAGILAALDWVAETKPQARWILTVPADCPFLPSDLVGRLHQAVRAQNTDVAVAESGGRLHPVVALWKIDLREKLRHALVVEQLHKASSWAERCHAAQTSWSTDPIDPFFNANTADDLIEAERLASLEHH
jgi:molybdenum cofactor guanylyltransferase